ncbi:hypothetical protein PAXRUDRAFT_12649 [Paxillus rubicundulus Ve08.2h10]|uniref:Uncharacterized protein n=1 Tax=Paxillus rubicundulus Ve08.2h10 TaxID=930991 RepID=A0A0D0D924_9AGAM|nr:hypothetical protein PAXRUDRAFT_12649 [Paxillus rubicundulus Ve08.2h10]
MPVEGEPSTIVAARSTTLQVKTHVIEQGEAPHGQRDQREPQTFKSQRNKPSSRVRSKSVFERHVRSRRKSEGENYKSQSQLGFLAARELLGNQWLTTPNSEWMSLPASPSVALLRLRALDDLFRPQRLANPGHKPLTLRDDRHVTCATITMCLSLVADYQQASLALTDGLGHVDQAVSVMQTVDYAVETYGQYIAPWGQALRLVIKLIDNVADVDTSTAQIRVVIMNFGIYEQQLNDDNVRVLAESLRELVGVASDCPVAEIKGTPDVIQSIERFALEVASLIDECIKALSWITDAKTRITACQAVLKDLYEKLRMRIMAYTAKCLKQTPRDKLSDQIREWLKAHDSSINHK